MAATTDALPWSEENAWALGCGECSFGLIDPPPKALAIPLSVVRAVYFRAGVLPTCSCRAGEAQNRYLRRVWQRIADKDEHVPDAWATAIHTEIRKGEKVAP